MATNRGIQKGIFWREFICLWTVAVGVWFLLLALLQMPSSVIARELFLPIPLKSSSVIFAAVVVQACVWLAIIIGAGLIVARKMGLGAPLLEAWLKHEPIAQRLRQSLIPIGITVLVLVGTTTLSSASWFRPKHARDLTATSQLATSPQTEQAFKELVRLGLSATGPLTPISEFVLHLDQAVESELNGRLFETSVVMLLLVQMLRSESSSRNHLIVCIAAVSVGVFHTLENVITSHHNTILITQVFQKYGLPHDVPPLGPAFARTGVRVIPSAVALGLLYASCGIEASFVANFCGIVLSNLLTILWLTHFS